MAKLSSEINLAGIRLSKKSDTPLYTQVYEQFRQMILSKRLRPGERLPASRNLARELGVSRVIISQGYEQLILEGYLVGKTGSGTFVAEQVPDLLLQVAKTDHTKKNGPGAIRAAAPEFPASAPYPKTDLVPFQTGVPSLDQFPYKSWALVGNRVLKRLKHFHLGYDEPLGYWPLRQSIASYLRVSRAVNCEADQVIVVTGSQQGLNLVVDGLLKKGDPVWMEDPGYPGATESFLHAGTKLCPIPVEEDGMNLQYAINRFGKAKMAYITPSHQFPLGYTLSHSKRKQLLDWAGKEGMWILEDDYDSEFRYEGRPLASLQGMDQFGRVIYSGTFSKVLFPGLRLAYIVLPSPEMVAPFRKIKEYLDRQSPMLDQLMVSQFMDEGYFLRHIRKMRLLYAERQKMLLHLINEHLGDYLRPEIARSGMHVLCWLSDKINPDRLKIELRKKKLIASFIGDYTIQHRVPPAITLGFTAFSKYKMKIGIEKLQACIQASL